MENKLKTFKEWEFVKSFIYNTFLAVFIVLVITIILSKIFTVRYDEVKSNSMAPDFYKGDMVVVVKQKEYKVGDTIEYKKGNILVSHEVKAVDKEAGTYTTSGIFEGAPLDSTVKISDVNGKVVAVWTNGALYYHIVKDNYFVVLTLVIGAWAISYAISNECEMKKHNILKV